MCGLLSENAHLTFTKQPPVPGGDDVEMPKLTLGNVGELYVGLWSTLDHPLPAWKSLNA